jgi:hypothetical protein
VLLLCSSGITRDVGFLHILSSRPRFHSLSLSLDDIPFDKKEIQPVSLSPVRSIEAGDVKVTDDEFEVFKATTDGVQFRLVGWIKASVIFLKSEYLDTMSWNTFI